MAVHPLARTLAAGLVTLALLTPVSTAQSDFFVLYSFEELVFEFHPEGLPKTHADDPDGSALVVKVRSVAVDDWHAYDLRHCMDGQDSCEYYNPSNPAWEANQDGEVQTSEVEGFTEAISAFVAFIPEVRNLTDLAQNNMTVDGEHSSKPRIQSVVFEGAEGSIQSQDMITAQVEIVARYDNDAGSDRHVIRVDDLPLREQGFTYDSVRWGVTGEEAWVFVPEATQPAEARSNTTAAGYTGSQDAFEPLTEDGFVLETAQEGGDGGGSPGVGVLLVLAASAVGFAALRRRSA